MPIGRLCAACRRIEGAGRTCQVGWCKLPVILKSYALTEGCHVNCISGTLSTALTGHLLAFVSMLIATAINTQSHATVHATCNTASAQHPSLPVC
jgi:hypothetical protein